MVEMMRLDSVESVRTYVSRMIEKLQREVTGWRPEPMDPGSMHSRYQGRINYQITTYQKLLDALEKGEAQIGD